MLSKMSLRSLELPRVHDVNLTNDSSTTIKIKDITNPTIFMVEGLRSKSATEKFDELFWIVQN